MRLGDLLEGLSYEVIQGKIDIEIMGIKNNSRDVEAGDLFFCVRGTATDGHSYAASVACKGAVALLVERYVKVPRGITVVRFPNIRYAMGIISARYYGNPSGRMTVIGITGTKGKTTTAYMVHNMLMAAGYKTGLIGTVEIYDGEQHICADHTTPESIVIHRYLRDMVNHGVDVVVMEVSSQGLMLDRVAGVEFDYGIFTNLSNDHVGPGEHVNFEHYKKCKKKLFSMCKTGIFNLDSSYAEEMMHDATCDKITYGMQSFADYRTDTFRLYSEDGVLGIGYYLTGKISGDIMIDMPGEFTVYNSLAAIAVADQMGVPFSDMQMILKKIQVRGRTEMIPISDAFTVMIDYAHNAMALENLIMALRSYMPKRLVTLFGCGGNRSRDRRYEMGEVSGRLSDLTIITSDNPRYEAPEEIMKDIKTGLNRTDGAYVEIMDRKEAMRYAIMNAEMGDVIVFAGKGHENYQEIYGVKYHMDERDLIREILEEEDVTKICGYNNRYFA